MEYDIVIGMNVLMLPTKVREKIAEGWKPKGGPFPTGQDYEVAQAIVRKTKEDKVDKAHSGVSRGDIYPDLQEAATNHAMKLKKDTLARLNNTDHWVGAVNPGEDNPLTWGEAN